MKACHELQTGTHHRIRHSQMANNIEPRLQLIHQGLRNLLKHSIQHHAINRKKSHELICRTDGSTAPKQTLSEMFFFSLLAIFFYSSPFSSSLFQINTQL